MDILLWMTKDGERKPVVREGVREELEAMGWVAETDDADKPRRGRPRKDEE